jgi:hypothetical protein
MEHEMLWVGLIVGGGLGLFAGYAIWGHSREAWYWARRIEEATAERERYGRDRI